MCLYLIFGVSGKKIGGKPLQRPGGPIRWATAGSSSRDSFDKQFDNKTLFRG
jgi:hypothetical protein